MSNIIDDIEKASRLIEEAMIENMLHRSRGTYSGFSNLEGFRPPTAFRPMPIGLNVKTSQFMVLPKKYSRVKSETIWQKIRRLFWGHNPWRYSPIEFYNRDIPMAVFNSADNTIICHPSIEQEIKKAIAEGTFAPTKR